MEDGAPPGQVLLRCAFYAATAGGLIAITLCRNMVLPYASVRASKRTHGRHAKPFPLTTDPDPNPDPHPNPHQVRAARLMHGGMVRAVLRAKVSWFEATPLGRVLNPNPNPSPSPSPNPNP